MPMALALTTAVPVSLLTGFGFIPMAVATTPGAEIQRPLATVVIGGLASSLLLTLVLVPVVYVAMAPDPAPLPPDIDAPRTLPEPTLTDARVV